MPQFASYAISIYKQTNENSSGRKNSLIVAASSEWNKHYR